MKEEVNKIEISPKKFRGQIILTVILSLIYLGLVVYIINDVDFPKDSLNIISALIGLSFILIWLPNNFNESINLWSGRVLFILTPIFTYLIIERFNNVNIWNVRGFCFLLNIIIITFLLFLLFFITNSIKIATFMTQIIFFLIALLNFYVFTFRSIPILATDITSLGTATSVANNYSYKINDGIVISALMIIVYLVIMHRLRISIALDLRKRVMGGIIYCILLGTFIISFYKSEMIKNAGIYVSNYYPQDSYVANGTLLSFMVSSKYILITKPDGYSLETVDNIIKPYINDSLVTSDLSSPNVIVIMDEAFSDLKQVGDFETSEDYMSFIRNLSTDSVKGTLYMPVFGGNTPNSEFEFLTGNTLAFLPNSSVPYKLYFKNPLASLTYTLKAQGYGGNIAIHPFNGDGWSRNTVYPLLGFEQFVTIDDFENPEAIRCFISDQSSFDRIMEEYEAERKTNDAPFYAFNVTMQNHGGYDTDFDNLDISINILGDKAEDSAEQYINLIKKTDEAFENLVQYFQQVEEPTVLVLFGDHQPAVSPNFYENIMGKDEADLTEEERMNKFQVPFVIWANYDIQEKQYDKLSANYLSSLLLNVIGARETGYNRFLIDLSEQVPVITSRGYYGADGNFYELDDETQYSEIINQYRILQYNNMFDIQNRRDDFFFLNDCLKTNNSAF